jgi:3-oxoacyl-[acyl-carrier protein] reductase
VFELTGKIALVTGASRGLGAGVAEWFAMAGATVVVNYLGSRSKAEGVLEKIRAMGTDGMIVQADVGNEESVKKMFDLIMETYGRLDICVCNAGVYKRCHILDTTQAEFEKNINTNLTGTFLCSKYAFAIMKEQKYGRIIMMSSVSAWIGTITSTVQYAASKAGQMGIAKTLALTGAPYNVTVNILAPCVIITDMTPDALNSKDLEYVKSITPLGLGHLEDVGAAAVFLASDEAKYITGAAIDITGGRYFR